MIGDNQNPQTTGSDILSYQGNAALGGGFDSHGQPIGTGEATLTPVNDMMKILQGQQFAFNVMQYKQAVQDRDQSMALLSDPSLQVTMDVNDKDRPALEAQRQAVIEQWKKDPAMSNADNWINFQKETAKFKEMATSSKSRNLEYKKQIGDIAAETNPYLREQMLQHLDGQVKGGVFKQIDPYFKNPTFDAAMFADVPMTQLGEATYSQDKTGAYSATKTMATPVKAFSDFVSPENLMANNGDKLQKLQLLHDNFVKSAWATDDNQLTVMNLKLAQINAKNKISPNDPAYLQPVAVKDENGWTVNDSPAQFGKSLYAYSHYKEFTHTDLAPDYQKQLAENATIGKIGAETKEIKAKTTETYADANLKTAEANEKNLTAPAVEYELRARAEKERREGNLIASKTTDIKVSALAPAFDGVRMFNDVYRYQSYSGQEAVAKIEKNNLSEGLRAAGYEDGFELTPLPRNNTYVSALSAPLKSTITKNGLDANGKSDGSKVTTSSAVNKPVYIFAFKPKDGIINDMKIVGLDKFGKLLKSINVKDAAGEIIKFNEGYKADDKVNNRIDAARGLTDEILGRLPENQKGASNSFVAPKPAPADPAVKQRIDAGQAKEIKDNVSGETYYNDGGKYYDKDGVLVPGQ